MWENIKSNIYPGKKNQPSENRHRHITPPVNGGGTNHGILPTVKVDNSGIFKIIMTSRRKGGKPKHLLLGINCLHQQEPGKDFTVV